MTGSLHDAEDLVQETFLRAWKAYDRFEGKSSVRTWLRPGASSTVSTSSRSRRTNNAAFPALPRERYRHKTIRVEPNG
jgi:RNA polymerase sigma factor (sigma-70 family)